MSIAPMFVLVKLRMNEIRFHVLCYVKSDQKKVSLICYPHCFSNMWLAQIYSASIYFLSWLFLFMLQSSNFFYTFKPRVLMICIGILKFICGLKNHVKQTWFLVHILWTGFLQATKAAKIKFRKNIITLHDLGYIESWISRAQDWIHNRR